MAIKQPKTTYQIKQVDPLNPPQEELPPKKTEGLQSADTIGNWTVERLVRFLQATMEENPPSRIPSLSCDDLTVNVKTNFMDQIQFTQYQTGVGAAGTASALPANPSGYLRILDYTGQPFVIPYYKAN